MAEIICGTDTIVNPPNCNDRGGIRSFYWFDSDDVDWDTMLGDPTKFNPTTQQILEFVMIGGATMNKVEFERKEAFYDFDFTEEADVYTLLLTFLFKGKDNDRKNSLQKAIACCRMGAVIFSNDGSQRVIGRDYNGLVFDNLLEEMTVKRHKDAGGQLGTSKSRDELDLGGESFFAPLFATLDESALPLV